MCREFTCRQKEERERNLTQYGVEWDGSNSESLCNCSCFKCPGKKSIWFLYKQRSGYHDKEVACAAQEASQVSSEGAAELHWVFELQGADGWAG